MSVARIATIAVFAVGALAGCVPSTPAPVDSPDTSNTPQATESAAPTPTASMPAFADDQIVLTISATATATNGASLDLVMQTYYPVAADSPEAAQIQDYLASVGNVSDVADPAFTEAKNAIIQVIKLTATATSGSWPAGSGVLPMLGPGATDTIIDMPAGPISGNRLSLTGAGNGFGVAAIYNDDGSPLDLANWANRFTSYGFADAFAGSRLTNCAPALTALGSGSPGVSGWSSHNCYLGRGD